MNSPSDNRSDRVRELTKKLEEGVKELFDSDRYRTYLSAMSRLHSYSFGNILLILMQCPEASMVAGYTTWKRAFGRSVKKGEHGIQIIAPVQSSRLTRRPRLDPDTGEPVLGPEGKEETEPVFVSYRSFRPAYVFDVSQTEGRELPSLGVSELQGDAADFDRLYSALESLSPVPIHFREPQVSKGCYSHRERCICINRGMSQVQTLKTLIHETAHAKLHALPVENGKVKAAPVKDRRCREVEAESIAYVVCQHFGIDTSDYSFGYITSWSSGKELEELKSSLDCISKTARELISGIEQQMPEPAIGTVVKEPEKCVSR